VTPAPAFRNDKAELPAERFGAIVAAQQL